MKSGVYQIRNKINGKIYIGSGVDIYDRWSDHRRKLKKKIHRNKYLERAWHKYGSKNFHFGILEITNSDKETILSREQFYMDVLESYDKNFGYNIARVAGSPLGYRHTEEAKRKIQEACVGVNNGMYGKKHTKEALRKISESSRGDKASTAKLTWEQVREIRQRHSKGGITYVQLAREYGVANCTIGELIRGLTWNE